MVFVYNLVWSIPLLARPIQLWTVNTTEWYRLIFNWLTQSQWWSDNTKYETIEWVLHSSVQQIFWIQFVFVGILSISLIYSQCVCVGHCALCTVHKFTFIHSFIHSSNVNNQYQHRITNNGTATFQIHLHSIIDQFGQLKYPKQIIDTIHQYLYVFEIRGEHKEQSAKSPKNGKFPSKLNAVSHYPLPITHYNIRFLLSKWQLR